MLVCFRAGLYFSGTTDYNGVEGFFLNLSATMIHDWVLWQMNFARL